MDGGGGPVGEVLTALNTILTEVRNLHTSMRNVRTEVARVSSSVEGMKEDLTKVQSRLEGVKKQEETLEALTSNVEEVKTNLREVKAAIGVDPSRKKRRLDAVGELTMNDSLEQYFAERLNGMEVEAPETYLSQLLGDAQTVVLRFLSSRPNSKSWVSHVNPRDVVTTLSETHPLQTVARESFKCLTITPPKFAESSQGLVMQLRRDKSAIRSILEAHSPRLEELVVADERDDIYRWPAYYTRSMNNLRVLDLGYGHARVDVCLLLRLNGAALQELHLRNENFLPNNVVDAIATHSGGLRALTLGHITTDQSLVHVWKKVGPSLNCLTLFPYRKHDTPGDKDWISNEMRQVEKHCVNLKDLGILGMPRDGLVATIQAKKLCRRIETLRLMKEVKLVPIVLEYLLKAFPAAAVDLELAQRRAVGQILAVGGSRLSSVKVQNYDGLSLEDLQAGADALGNVESLTMFTRKKSRPSHGFFEAFFVTPKRMLRDLDLDCTFPPKEGADSVLDVIARSSGALKHFRCILKAQPLPNDAAMDALLRANPQLHRVCIKNTDEEGTAVERSIASAASLVTRIATTNVRQLVIEGWSLGCRPAREIENACSPIRIRRFDICIGHVRYLPSSGNEIA